MKYKAIKNTNLLASSICLGTADMGSAINKENSYNMLDYFMDNGGNFIDTAHVYANWLPGERSISEKTIGQWIKRKGCRDKVIVCTKGAHPELSSMNVPRLSNEDIARDLNESLEYLQTDYIDLYLLHRDDVKRPVGEIIEFLNAQVKSGKIRYFGCSNWKAERIKEANAYAKEHGLAGFSASEIMWSLAKPNDGAIGDPTIVYMTDEEKKFYLEIEMSVMAFTSQARGFFNKITKGDLSNIKEWVKGTYYNEENMRRYERIIKLSKDMNISVTSVVLCYLISQPFTSIPIVGNQSIEQLKESIDASDICFSQGIVKYLEEGVL
jgi:aryl-alcohol dehydrogenase-like predicted oxidoreductase